MLKRISENEVIVEGNPANACSPSKFWHVIENGIHPVYEDGFPIQYSVEAGSSVYAADLSIVVPEKKVLAKVEVDQSA
jgi:hypothetical protein